MCVKKLDRGKVLMFLGSTFLSVLAWYLSGVEFVRSPELAFGVIVNILFVFFLSIRFNSDNSLG